MVAHKSYTALDASRRERNFTIGKSCESPRLKGVSFDKQCFSNHLPQRWARARAEQGNAAAGIGPLASRASCFPRMGKSGRRRIGQGQRLTYAKSQDGTYLFQDGEGNADEDRRKQQPMVPLLEAAAEHEHKGRGLVSNNTHSGVPCLTLCPRSWGAHDNLQFPSQTESEDQRAGADWRHERPSSCKFHIRAVYSTDQL